MLVVLTFFFLVAVDDGKEEAGVYVLFFSFSLRDLLISNIKFAFFFSHVKKSVQNDLLKT